MAEEKKIADTTAKKQPRGRPFEKGQSGNPAGRPKGSVSIKDEIRRRLKESPEEFEKLCEFYLKDIKMRELLWKMLEGLPRQSVELGLDEAIGEVNISIKKNEDSKPTINNGIPKELPRVAEQDPPNPNQRGGNGIKQNSKPRPADGNDNAEREEQADNDSTKVPASPEGDGNEGLPEHPERTGGV